MNQASYTHVRDTTNSAFCSQHHKLFSSQLLRNPVVLSLSRVMEECHPECFRAFSRFMNENVRQYVKKGKTADLTVTIINPLSHPALCNLCSVDRKHYQLAVCRRFVSSDWAWLSVSATLYRVVRCGLAAEGAQCYSRPPGFHKSMDVFVPVTLTRLWRL